MAKSQDKWLFLVDASVYIFRAWHAYPDDLFDEQGHSANAVHGFATFLCQLLERARPRHIGVAFDESLLTSFRNQIYPAYKANREPPPPELERQMKACRKLAELMGMTTYASDIYEADDLIGTLAIKMRPHGFRTAIVSRDKDLSQLLAERDVMWDFANDKKIRHSEVKAQYGAEAHQIIDLLALAGDAVDNIPGVPGVGRKTAEALLERLGSLDEIYERLDEVEFFSIRGAKRVKQLLQEHREMALISRQLTAIATDAPIEGAPENLERKELDQEALETFCEFHNFDRYLGERCLASRHL
ncbi:hypothetical protein BOW53_00055 [Solemya pervernicosa gill symbiont]|uniref:5'-3' exonuclease domain-containing protein n=2 Tax=Gammaproteobacteria incertae sedis TaxID=118884 RepID=A0A1T2LB48_9GAMM|nr:5'-3' exonuclease H3TH domain-containing protein [Candidatus Reidiella endopervernicosa]OOZ42274.1 hypothetical protein BOW53_00055 [Solemya pervernicosa gill symbiont]QKQ25671.1 exodeoxyribonuclease IX [Candidatus Reidiella endopervernicosa]